MARKTYKKKSTKKVVEEAPVMEAPIVDEVETDLPMETAVEEIAAKPKPAPAPAPKPKHRDLTRGDSGDDVAKVQAAVGVPTTGEFDFGTLTAVKKWQKVNGLAADGIVGPLTREKLL